MVQFTTSCANEIIITALGLAYREFAIEVGRKLNLGCNEDWYSGIKKPIKAEEYIFHR